MDNRKMLDLSNLDTSTLIKYAKLLVNLPQDKVVKDVITDITTELSDRKKAKEDAKIVSLEAFRKDKNGRS